MRRVAILKTIADIIFVLSLIFMFFAVPLLLVIAVMPEMVPFKIMGLTAAEFPIEGIIIGFTELLGCTLWIFALFLFRKTLALFGKKKFFDVGVITNLDQIGKAIIAGCLLFYIPGYLYENLREVLITSHQSDGIIGMLFGFALGLFFMVLSEVFLIAKAQKEENDLTV